MMLEVLDPDEANSRATLFDTTTSLTPRPGRPGQFWVHLDPVWSSLVGMHGGYLAALAIRASEIVVGDRPIRTVTTSFLRPASAGPAEVEVEVVREGRSVTNLTVTFSQLSKAVVVSQVTAADAVESTVWETFPALDLPAIEHCVPIAPPSRASIRRSAASASATPFTCTARLRVSLTTNGSAASSAPTSVQAVLASRKG